MADHLLTIGHSSHAFAVFLDLLQRHGVGTVADVRSAPVSRFNPQYNKAALAAGLAEAGIAYRFLGAELGARPRDPACVVEGRIDHDRIAARPHFAAGLAAVKEMAAEGRGAVTLMCAERDPIDCHRAVLVCRHLRDSGLEIAHVHPDGSLEPHPAFESRLLALYAAASLPLFAGSSQAGPADLTAAYTHRSREIGFHPRLPD